MNAEPPPPDPLAPAGTPLTGVWRRVAAPAAAAVLVLAAVHAGMTVLYVAEDYPLEPGHRRQVGEWMRPHFPQDWAIFAPDPVSVNRNLEVRVHSGGGVGEWIDLTEESQDAHRGDPVPSRHDQGALRKALGQHLAGSPEEQRDAPVTRSARLLYHTAIARLEDLGKDPGDAIELRVRSTGIPSPDSMAAPPAPEYVRLGTWEVTP